MVDRGYPVSRACIDDKAMKLCPELKCSNTWFETLKKNYPGFLCLRRTERLDRLRAGALNTDVIQHYTDFVGTLIGKMDLTPDKIWNMDETGCSMDQHRLYTYCRRGRKNVYASSAANREHVTIVSAVSASGEYCPEFFIFKGVNDFEALNNANPGADFKMSPKGYMTDEVWPYWAKHFLDCLPPAEERGYVLLVMDGYGSHCNDATMLEIFEKHKVICLGLPAHTSSALQPLDVGVFGPLKKAIRRAFSIWLKNNPGETFKREFFAELVAVPWREAHKKDSIVASFKKAGLWPHDPELVKKVCVSVSDPLYIAPDPEILCVSRDNENRHFFPTIEDMLKGDPKKEERLHALTDALDLQTSKKQKVDEIDPVDAILSYPNYLYYKRKQPKRMLRKRKTSPPSSTKPDLPSSFYDLSNEEDTPDPLDPGSLTLASFARILNGPQRLALEFQEKEKKLEEENRKKEMKSYVNQLEKPIVDLMTVHKLERKGKNGLILDDYKAIIRHCGFSVSLTLKTEPMLLKLSPLCEEKLTQFQTLPKNVEPLGSIVNFGLPN
eukprot:Lithocolla_globosa_v1_NODE_2107_length_2165_cov_4.812322.p1 type:complete len:553 gc:universal NODE_2107_length_2165_cov_4.812322:148-1806(+)